MASDVPFQLAMIVVVGIAAQWIAWRVRLPAIVLLLSAGLVMGPGIGFLSPDDIMGEAVVPIVSLSVAIILFEGGMSLQLRELKGTGGSLTMLVTLGAAVTWILCSLFAVWVLGFDNNMAALFGAILIVTGPTVIGPLLRHVRPTGKSGTLLKWEGLTIDPIGAIAAVLTFEFLFAGHGANGAGEAFGAIVATFVYGTFFGLVGALVTVVFLKRFWIPDFLINPASVALVMLAYVGSNYFQTESGLVAVTVMGIALANQRWVKVCHILEFKENLRVLLISCLFVLLASRLSPEILAEIRWQHAAYLLLLIVVVRPVAVFLSTLGSKLDRKERLFVALMAPRGIVAAAIASVFALQLEGEEGELLVTTTYLVIIGTVVIYGFAALPIARWLKLAQPEPNGLLIIGSNRFSQGLAVALKELEVEVTVVDTNMAKVAQAQELGITAEAINYLDSDAREELDISGLGTFVAMTSNDNANEILAVRGMEDFGRVSVYRLSRKARTPSEKVSAHSFSGRVLFGDKLTYQALMDRIEAGWKFAIMNEVKSEESEASLEILLVVVGADKQVRLMESTKKLTVREGDRVVCLVSND